KAVVLLLNVDQFTNELHERLTRTEDNRIAGADRWIPTNGPRATNPRNPMDNGASTLPDLSRTRLFALQGIGQWVDLKIWRSTARIGVSGRHRGQPRMARDRFLTGGGESKFAWHHGWLNVGPWATSSAEYSGFLTRGKWLLDAASRP